ncbi:MAG: hypothetical protein R3Y56_09070 [Akkermansia sp.]
MTNTYTQPSVCRNIAQSLILIAQNHSGWSALEGVFHDNEEIRDVCKEVQERLGEAAQLTLVQGLVQFGGDISSKECLQKAILLNAQQIEELTETCLSLIQEEAAAQDEPESDEPLPQKLQELLKPITEFMLENGLGDITITRKGKENC